MDSFKDYIVDQLDGIKDVWTREMFSSFGLYSGEVFFGIISDDILYFKTNDSTRDRYTKAGMKPFAPSEKQVLKNYYEVPEEIIDNREELADWALEAIGVCKESKNVHKK